MSPTAGDRVLVRDIAVVAGVALTMLGIKMVKLLPGLPFAPGRGKDRNARHIPRISAEELLARDLPDLALERVVIRYLTRSRWCKECQIVNGLKPDHVRAALAGEDAGTIVYSDR